MRHNFRPGRLTLVAMACGALVAACGGGGDSGDGRLQAITFDYPGGATLASGSYPLKATSTSGLTVSFSSATPATCTVSGAQMTPVSAGECRIVASQSGGTDSKGVKWAAADDTSQLFTVLKHPQMVGIVAPEYVTMSATSSITLSTVTTSGKPATLSGGTPGVCTLSGNTVTILGKGNCAISAAEPGDANYLPGQGNAFIGVDPLIVAEGITGAGQGDSVPAQTKQGGKVSAKMWTNALGGWQGCGRTDDTCFTAVSADQRVFTSALHAPTKDYPGWHCCDYNNVEIFGPGLTAFNSAGDTTGGLQVTTEQYFALTLGVNPGFFAARKPVLVQLDLGKSDGKGCNVTVSASLLPALPVGSYAIPLNIFATTEDCGLGLDKVSEDAVKGSGDVTAARASALQLIQTSNVVRVRLRMTDINVDVPDGTYYGSDLSIIGSIRLQ